MIGFVYIWFDRRRRMFYLGSHVGRENDGYICSSSTMLAAYRERRSDFRRRIISRGEPSEIRKLEERWLQLIKPEELGIRYYNLKLIAWGFETHTVKAINVIREKALKDWSRYMDEERSDRLKHARSYIKDFSGRARSTNATRRAALYAQPIVVLLPRRAERRIGSWPVVLDKILQSKTVGEAIAYGATFSQLYYCISKGIIASYDSSYRNQR